MMLACPSGVFGCMVTRGVVLKIQIMLSISFTEWFRGKVTAPPRAPTSSFRVREAAGPLIKEQRRCQTQESLSRASTAFTALPTDALGQSWSPFSHGRCPTQASHSSGHWWGPKVLKSSAICSPTLSAPSSTSAYRCCSRVVFKVRAYSGTTA